MWRDQCACINTLKGILAGFCEHGRTLSRSELDRLMEQVAMLGLVGDSVFSHSRRLDQLRLRILREARSSQPLALTPAS